MDGLTRWPSIQPTAVLWLEAATDKSGVSFPVRRTTPPIALGVGNEQAAEHPDDSGLDCSRKSRPPCTELREQFTLRRVAVSAIRLERA